MSVSTGFFDPFRKIGDDLYKCDSCRRTMHKRDSLILYNRQKRRTLRVCRDCQLEYYLKELKQENPHIDIKLKFQQFAKNIKDGIDNRK